MRLNTAMYTRRFHRALARRFVDIKSQATKSWTICAEESVRVPPAIYFENEIDKIKGLSPWRNWEAEEALMKGTLVTHMATVGYQIPNVNLVGAFIYSGAAKMQPGYGSEKLLVDNNSERKIFDVACLITSNSGSHFFGTYLLDDIPLSMITEDDLPQVAMITKPYRHAQGYRSLLEIDEPKILTRSKFKSLILYQDFSQNSCKEERYRKLRYGLSQKLGVDKQPSAHQIYLKRGGEGEKRSIVNEGDVMRHLVSEGFKIVDPSTMSSKQTAMAIFGATLVVSIEGSHLSHAIYATADDCTYLILQPPDRLALAYKEFTDRMDMRFAFVVGDPAEGGFKIELDALRRMIATLT